MGTMSASDAVPLPRLGEVFFDVRGDSRTLRLSWYADTGVAVLSIWQGGMCTGTFRLAIADLPRMVETLQRGPERPTQGQRDDHRAEHRAGPAQYPAEATAYAAAPTEYSAGTAQYPAESPAYAAAPAEYATGPAEYATGPAGYATGPAQYPAEPPAYAAPPAGYATGPARYPAEPPAYAAAPAEYSAGTAQYPAGTAQYSAGPAEYAVGPADDPAELADPRRPGYPRPQPGVPSEPTQQWEPHRSGPEDYRPRPTQYPSDPAGYPHEPAGYPAEPAGYPAGYASGPSGRSHRQGATVGRHQDRGTDSSPYSRAPAPADYLDEMRPGQYPAGTSAPRLGEDLDRTTADYPQHYDAMTDDPRAARDELTQESLPYGSRSANRVAPGRPARPGVPFG
jgi:hypothetical protein